ncbi:MAG: endonuclease/exonuclease/phosphatase family protein [Acidimicrobiia bacterium]|nr:endonuclease/exonuclease/phosphatase family protein [Acidimicrobiia bacterium]
MRRIAVAVLIVAAVAATVLPVGPASAAKSDADVTVVNLNLLHGVFCEPESDGCQAADRVALLMEQLEASNCPDIVGLQEINEQLSGLLKKATKTACDGAYEYVFAKTVGLDTERILTTLPVKSTKVIKLNGNFRAASRAVLKSPAGPIVIVVTHQDGDPDEPFVGPCRSCTPPCGADTTPFACQTVAAVDLADRAGGKKAIRILMGDFNVGPTSERYLSLLADGWIDSHIAAGNPECVPASGVNCTSGRDDQTIVALKDPNAKESERIDFIFVKPPGGCEIGFDTPDDGDGDGLGTALFFNEPAVDGPGGLVWTSDHTGVSADFSCESGD